ncbi:hypothetical protein CPB86DRAFT_781312 [Serendipita vermifera]|nr:hypothetical protein CPB86DRAFT_781312 [Serendipita vermifera]
MTRIAIRSIASKKYLSLDGNGLDHTTEQGGGKAKTQNFVGDWETFIPHEFPDHTIAFESAAFPNVYLRLAPLDISPGHHSEKGGGVVNAQVGSLNYEKFRIKQKDQKGAVAIESLEFPGRYLRMDGDIVNVQGDMGPTEEFELLMLG